MVIILAGRFAGRKAVVLKSNEDGDDATKKKFGHAIVAGIDRHPRKVTRSMKAVKVEKRCKIKPFVKTINFNHIMPTRYTVDFDFKKAVDESATSKEDNRKAIKKLFEEKYKNQTAKSEKKTAGVQYFFSKLRF